MSGLTLIPSRNVWKPCSDQPSQDEHQFSIWRLCEQFTFANNHLLCYRPTTLDLILKICPKFRVLRSHLFEVDELQWAKLCKVNIFQLQSMSNAIRCIVQRFALNNSVIALIKWYSSWAIREGQSCRWFLHSKKRSQGTCRLRNTESNILFFPADWHKSWLSG